MVHASHGRRARRIGILAWKKTAARFTRPAICVKITPFTLFKASALRGARQDRGAGTASVDGRGGIRGRRLKGQPAETARGRARPLVMRRTSASLPPNCGGGAVADRSVAFRQSGQAIGTRKSSPGHLLQARRPLWGLTRFAPCPPTCERIPFRRFPSQCPTLPPAPTPACAEPSRLDTSR